MSTPEMPTQTTGDVYKGQWQIAVDYQFTRRKAFHFVIDPQGEVQFRHRHIWPCLSWLYDNEVPVYFIRPAGYPDLPPFAVLARAASEDLWQSLPALSCPSEHAAPSGKPL